MQVGDVSTWERTFTIEDVRQFGQISGDLGIHHVEPDVQGRLLVQGLLTATLPTKLGGDLNLLASSLSFEFRRPVFTGDTIRCENTVIFLEKREGHMYLEASFICRNQHGKEVLTGYARGIIRDS